MIKLYRITVFGFGQRVEIDRALTKPQAQLLCDIARQINLTPCPSPRPSLVVRPVEGQQVTG